MENILYILAAILAFSILVVGHEFGHFIAAKLNGVKVEEFSLGMGPKLFGIKKGETEYLIKAAPIGGYVKMLGEEEESNDERSFSSKSPLQRLSIVAAGPIMNIIMAIIFFAIFTRGFGYATTKVFEVQDKSPAKIIGVKSGDEVIKFNNEKINTWTDFLGEMAKSKGEKLQLTVLRENKELNFNITPQKNEEGRYIIGIAPIIKKPNIGEAFKSGVTQTVDTTKLTFGFFKNLFRGKIKKDDVGGPITIMRVSVMTASKGVLYLVYFMALLSVQLAIFNIIPFPALDGGWIFLLLLQIITGKKFDDDKIGMINYIGFIILLSLMVLVTIKDIVSPIKL